MGDDVGGPRRQSMLFQPLGMDGSSYRHADYEARDNKAVTSPGRCRRRTRCGSRGTPSPQRRRRGPGRRAELVRQRPEQFLRLQLGHGTVDGTEHVDAAALEETHFPHQEISPADAGRARPVLRTGLERHLRRRGPGAARPLGRVRAARPPMACDRGRAARDRTLTNGGPTGAPRRSTRPFDIARTVARPGLAGAVRGRVHGDLRAMDQSTPTEPRHRVAGSPASRGAWPVNNVTGNYT